MNFRLFPLLVTLIVISNNIYNQSYRVTFGNEVRNPYQNVEINYSGEYEMLREGIHLSHVQDILGAGGHEGYIEMICSDINNPIEDVVINVYKDQSAVWSEGMTLSVSVYFDVPIIDLYQWVDITIEPIKIKGSGLHTENMSVYYKKALERLASDTENYIKLTAAGISQIKPSKYKIILKAYGYDDFIIRSISANFTYH